MKLIDLLSQILRAHALSLQALRSQMGHNVLLERIALLHLRLDPHHPFFNLREVLSPLQKSSSPDPRDPYGVIEDTVARYCAHPDLEVHLWSYPLYRSIIESDLSLTMDIVEADRSIAWNRVQMGARHWLEEFFLDHSITPAAWEPWL